MAPEPSELGFSWLPPGSPSAGRPLSINLITLLKFHVPQFPADSRVSLQLEPSPPGPRSLKPNLPRLWDSPKHRYLSPGPPGPRLAFLRSGGPKNTAREFLRPGTSPDPRRVCAPESGSPRPLECTRPEAPQAPNSQTPSVWYFRPGTPRLPRTRVPRTRDPPPPQNPGARVSPALAVYCPTPNPPTLRLAHLPRGLTRAGQCG